MDKGPVGRGLRLQDSLRLGAFKVEACAAKVTTDGAQGGKDEAWGGRAHVRYDWLPVGLYSGCIHPRGYFMLHASMLHYMAIYGNSRIGRMIPFLFLLCFFMRLLWCQAFGD